MHVIIFCFQAKPLVHNISGGVIITDQSLVLQKVTRLSAGNYTCIGRNTEGEGVSEAFSLDVLCKFNFHFVKFPAFHQVSGGKINKTHKYT